MVDLYTCPADGCEYGPADLEGIGGHYGGKRDEAHRGGPGEGKYQAKEQGPVDSEPAQSSSETSSPNESGGAGAISFPDSPGNSSECPTCDGEDWYDADELLDEFGDEFGGDERELLEQHDRVCAGCGEVYDV